MKVFLNGLFKYSNVVLGIACVTWQKHGIDMTLKTKNILIFQNIACNFINMLIQGRKAKLVFGKFDWLCKLSLGVNE